MTSREGKGRSVFLGMEAMIPMWFFLGMGVIAQLAISSYHEQAKVYKKQLKAANIEPACSKKADTLSVAAGVCFVAAIIYLIASLPA